MRSPSRTTNGSKWRTASSIVIRPSRTTCGTERIPASVELALDEAQDFLGVLADLDLGEHAPDGALAVDDEGRAVDPQELPHDLRQDRKSTRLNSSHRTTSYAVFCLTKKTSS